MNIRYYVCGLCYDKNNCIIDHDFEFGDFDTYQRAYELFVKLQGRNPESFFTNNPEVYQMVIQVEKCEETDDEISCVDIKNEWWIDNPNYKEED